MVEVIRGTIIRERKRITVATLIILVLLSGAVLLFFSADSAAAYPPGWTVQMTPTGASNVYEFSAWTWDRYVFVVWRDTGASIWFQRSCDYGSTWNDAIMIENGSQAGTGEGVKVIMSGNAGGDFPGLYVMYSSTRDTETDGGTEIWIAKSTDGGVTWPAYADRWHSGAAYAQYDVDADSLEGANQTMVVCAEKRNGSWMEIKYLGYIDTGCNFVFEDDFISTLNDAHSYRPSITCKNSADAVVVWSDGGPVDNTHRAIGATRTENRGSSWEAPTTLLAQSDRDFNCPEVSWEVNNPVMICQGKNTSNNLFSLYECYLNEVYGTWRGHDGSDPPTVSGSNISGSTTQSVEPVPVASGPWNYETVLFNNDIGKTAMVDLYTVPNINCGDVFGAIGPNGNYKSSIVEQRGLIGIAANDGKIYLRRKDTGAPATQLANPPTGQQSDTYINGNFNMTCTAVDNLDITASDLASGYNYYHGIRRVEYQYSEDDGSTWNPVECTTGEASGHWYAAEPPYTLTAVAEKLAGRRILIRACAEDSAGGEDLAGNIGFGESPGYVVVDMDPPGSVLNVSGTKGQNGFYTSFAGCTLSSTDPNTASMQYQLSNSQTATGGATDNWTTYTKPFTLTDGIWTVEHRAIDKAGNIGTIRRDTVKVDTVDPVCSITRPKRDTIQTGYYEDETFRLGGTGTDVNDLQWAGIFVDNKMVYQTSSAFNMAYVWSLAGVSEGNHVIMVKALDTAGNMGAASKNVWIGNAVKDWYFAEGNTLPEFDEYICLMNPGDTSALVQIQFMLENGQVITHERSMRPKQRDTVKVKDYVEQGHHVSTKVHCSEQAIIAERPMYFMYKNVWKGGHNAMGVNVLQKDWYFAEGTTRNNSSDGCFEEWITVMNPSENQAANITITYMLADGSNPKAYYTVAPHSRLTVEAAKDVGIDKDLSAKVSSDIPIAAERPMYFDYHGYAVDGSDVVGTSGPGNIWYFAEGATHPGFQEWLTIQNPNDVPANCKLTYMTGSGAVTTFDKVVPPRTRGTVDVLSQVGDNENVSTRVESDVPIIAERPMYFIYGADAGKGWDGGEAAMGNPDPSTQYFLAEGCTINNFDTWYTLQNPRDDRGCKVNIEYCFGDGTTQNLEYWIEPHSRLTINVNDAVKRQADVSGAITASFPIVIERPMYFNYKGITGGHDVVGFGVD